MIRVDGRDAAQMRDVRITINPLRHPEGSAMVEVGGTRVLCAATCQDTPPPHRKGTGLGWLSAEYAMLPGCSAQRVPRDGMKGKVAPRSSEIQRLVGRVLRSVFRMDKFGERTIIIDCDVIEADGGTRTAAITGGFVALALAVRKLRADGRTAAALLTDFVAATSVGIVEGVPVLDLCYLEDSQAGVDMNVAVTGAGKFVEVQGTAEGHAFERGQLDAMLDLAQAGCARLIAAQKEALGCETLE